jgi:AcrR family transcriptional regulator
MSPARARTSTAAIVAAARDLLEDGGLEAVSMAAVAERVGVRAPSLYKHFGDRSGLLAAVATDAALDLGRTLSGAVDRSGADANARLQALAWAYRSFALAKPRAAALIFAGVAPGATPTPESQTEAARPVLQVAETIVGPARALAAARVLTAFAYGFGSMESAGAFRFGGNVEEAYGLGVSVLASGLERVAGDGSNEVESQAGGGAAG